MGRTTPRLRIIEAAPVAFLLLLCIGLTVAARPVMKYLEITAQTLHTPRHYIEAVLSGATRSHAYSRNGAVRRVPPVMAVVLLALWLLLNNAVDFGSMVLGALLSVALLLAAARLRPLQPRMRRAFVAIRLIFTVLVDVMRSNICRRTSHSGPWARPSSPFALHRSAARLERSSWTGGVGDDHHLHAWHGLGEPDGGQTHADRACARPGR